MGGWRVPFFTLAALGALVIAAAMAALPPQRAHLLAQSAPFCEVLRRPVVRLGLATGAIGAMAHYMLVPNLSAYVQLNLCYPRDRLGLIYMIGGAFVFGTTRLAGWLADRHGASPVVLFDATLYFAVLIVGFIYPVDAVPVIVVFVGLMISSSFRFIPVQALLPRIPAPGERARFMSIQGALESITAGSGAMMSAQILTEHPDRSPGGIDDVAWLAIALTCASCALGRAIEHRIRVDVRPTGS